jgi:hypothetical protein
MADKMTYQEARRIRNKDYSLSKLITQNIRRSDMSAGAAIKEAFREKFDIKTRTKAKITGIKEKFDPLNIAKFLTFGSNVAPALLGRMTGRSKADIANFTGGRAKPYESATRIGKLEGDDSGMTEILDKIYTFMKSNQEDDIRNQELQNNRREEEMNEDAIRHKKLLEALAKLTGNKVEGTAEKVKGEEGSSIADILSDLLSAFGGLKMLKNVGGWLVRLALNPYILIPLLVAGGIWYAIDSFKKNDEEQNAAAAKGDVETLRKKIEAGLGDEAGMYANQDEMVKNALKKANTPESLDALKKMEEGERPKTSADKYDQFLADKGYYKSMGYKNLKGEMVPDDLKKAAMEYASGQPKAEETPTQNTSGTTVEEAAQARSDFAKTDPRMVGSATEAEAAAGASANLVRATNENNNLKLEDLTSVPTINSVNSSQTNVGKSSNPKQSLPPVRNLEETFQRMILNSTKVV